MSEDEKPSPQTYSMPDLDTIARAISSRYPSGDGSNESEAWYWADLHNHPGNEFAHECRDEDRQIAKAVLAVLSHTPPEIEEMSHD